VGAGLLKERLVHDLVEYGHYDLDTDLAGSVVKRAEFRWRLQHFFDCDGGELLFYFYGHGCLSPGGGVFATSDGVPDDWGVAMFEVTHQADNSPAHEVVMILDCCHAGAALPASAASVTLPSQAGRVVLAGCAEHQHGWEAKHEDEKVLGAFSAHVLNGLEGAASYSTKWVTGTKLCTYVTEQFRSWKQSPVYSVSGGSRSRACNLTYGFPETANEPDLDTLKALFERAAFSPSDYDGDPTAPLNAMHETRAALQQMGVRRISDPEVKDQFLEVMERLLEVEAEMYAKYPEVSRLAVELTDEPVRTPERMMRLEELDPDQKEEAVAYVRLEGDKIKGFVDQIGS
jgi:hypothetical protein